MKKLLLLLIYCASIVTLNAQVFTEYFQDATPGMNLEDYNDWYVTLKSGEDGGVSPVIEGETLFYDNYAGSDTGYVAVLDSLIGMDNDDGSKRISSKLVVFEPGDTLLPVVGEKMYAAFLCNIGEHSKDSWRDFFTWEGSPTGNWSRGRLFVKVQNDGADLQFAVTKNSSSEGDMVATEVIPGGVGLYHLLVFVYETFGEATNDDQIHLYVNPDPLLSEAEQTAPLTNIDVQTDYNEVDNAAGKTPTKIKINLRQRGIGAQVGGIRVGRVWEDVLAGVEDPVRVRELERVSSNIHSYRNTIITDGAGAIEVYDISGRRVMNHITNGRLETSLGSGLYIVRFEDNSGNVSTGKVSLNSQ